MMYIRNGELTWKATIAKVCKKIAEVLADMTWQLNLLQGNCWCFFMGLYEKKPGFWCQAKESDSFALPDRAQSYCGQTVTISSHP